MSSPASIQDWDEAEPFLLHGIDGLSACGLGVDGDWLSLGQGGEGEVPPLRQGPLWILQAILIQPLVVSELGSMNQHDNDKVHCETMHTYILNVIIKGWPLCRSQNSQQFTEDDITFENCPCMYRLHVCTHCTKSSAWGSTTTTAIPTVTVILKC